MKRNIIIRADGSTSIGMGHLVRSLALADMLKNDFNISFAIQEPTKEILSLVHLTTENIIELPYTTDFAIDAINFTKHINSKDIIVLDGYNFKTDYQQQIKQKGCKLVCIDDLHAWHQVADAIINHADDIREEEYSSEDYTKYCLGLDYALLRKDFLKSPPENRNIQSLQKAFISMGAADTNNITQKFAEALLQIPSVKEINLMLGSVNPNLKKIDALIKQYPNKLKSHLNLSAGDLARLLRNCDVSICPASSIALESCSIGIVLISGYTAENQLGNLKGMEKHKTLINFGDMNILSVEEIRNKFKDLMNNKELFTELLHNQQKMIDKNSPQRLLNFFKSLN